jgi:hypothetical protein
LWRKRTAVGGAIYGGILSRVDAEKSLARTTSEAAVPSVTIIHPTAGAPQNEIALPGYTQGQPGDFDFGLVDLLLRTASLRVPVARSRAREVPTSNLALFTTTTWSPVISRP